jgi:hypothetical protein
MAKYTPKPFASEREARETAGWVADQTARAFNISFDEAARRVQALAKSGIMEGGHPDDPEMQAKITAFLSIPSRTYAHLK